MGGTSPNSSVTSRDEIFSFPWLHHGLFSYLLCFLSIWYSSPPPRPLFFKPTCVNFSSCPFHEGCFMVWCSYLCRLFGQKALHVGIENPTGSISHVPPPPASRFRWEARGSTPWTSFHASVFGHLESLGDHLRVKGDVAEEIIGELQARCSAEKGKRAATAWPWKPFVHVCVSILPSSFIPTSWRLPGDSEPGGTLGIQDMQQPCGFHVSLGSCLFLPGNYFLIYMMTWEWWGSLLDL